MDPCGFGCAVRTPVGVSASAGVLSFWRRVRDSNPRTVVGPPFTDLQSVAFDLSANPPQASQKASGSSLATRDGWLFVFITIEKRNIKIDVKSTAS